MRKGRKQKTRKLVSMGLCAALSAALLAGCGGTPAGNGKEPAEPAAGGTEASGSQGEETSGGQGTAAADEVQTEPVVFVVRGINDIENKSNNEAVLAKIKEESGVDFELVVIPTDSWSEKINLMITSGDKWDVLNVTEDAGNWNQYYQKNALKPWDEYLDDMPNIKARLNEDSLRGCTTADGAIYALPRKELFSKQFVPAIRQDWLDALNMECPTTMEELEAYFQGVIDENLNGNDNEIPMMTFMNMENSDFRPFYLGFFGDHYLTEDGTIMPWYMHENSYLLLEELQKWYKNGWLHSEYQTMSIQDGFDLISADRAGGWTGPYNAGVSPSMTIFENDPDSAVKYVSLDNFTDFPAGGTGAWGMNPEYQPELVLNANSENAKWAAKLLNWMFENEDNYMLCAHGFEGTEWSYADDSKKEYVLADNYADSYLGFYLLNEWYDETTYAAQYVNPEEWKPVQIKELQDKINSLETIEACDWFVPYDLTGTEAEFLTGDSDTVINEACAKVVSGQWGESEWKSAVEEAWNTEGKIYSEVWTEQYHAFTD